jgi:hypothetical protein
MYYLLPAVCSQPFSVSCWGFSNCDRKALCALATLYGIPVKMRGDVNQSREEKGCYRCLTLSLRYHFILLFLFFFSKNEIAIILQFAAITTRSVVLVSIYYINSVTVTDAARVLS